MASRLSLACCILAFAPWWAAAQTPTLVSAGLSKGSRQSFTIRSAILKETRRVEIALPASFVRTQLPRRYPTMIVLDGESLLQPVQISSRQLVAQGQIPESVMVAIENTDRLHDLTPPGISVSGSSLNEGGDLFLDFIERELIPALDRQFRTAAPRILVGHSSGGILATYAAATRTTFRVVVALDTPTHLGNGWLAEKLIARAAAPQGPLHFSSYNAVFGWAPNLWQRLVAAAPATWTLQHDKFLHETHNSMTLVGSYLGLREAFARYSKVAAPTFPTTATLSYYQTMTDIYGAPIEPPEALMREIVEDLLMEGRAALARAVFTRIGVTYGSSPDALETRRKIADAERFPPPKESVESLLGQPFPAPNEAQEIIGDWNGEDWMNDGEHTPFTLRIRSVDGKVTGERIDVPEPGTELKMPLEYLKLGPDEFVFGFRNGMRPRGMLMFRTRRRGDHFEGIMDFGGISEWRPDGSKRPTIHVRLTKVK